MITFEVVNYFLGNQFSLMEIENSKNMIVKNSDLKFGPNITLS